MFTATVTYALRGFVPVTVTVTNSAPSRLLAGQAINRFMLGLRSECYEIRRDIYPGTSDNHASAAR